MRIYELAKILNVSNKEIMQVAEEEFGVEGIKNHMSSVKELEAAKIQNYFIHKNKDEEKIQTKEEKKRQPEVKTDDKKKKNDVKKKEDKLKKEDKQKKEEKQKEEKTKYAVRDLKKKEKGKKQQYKKSKDEEEENLIYMTDSIRVKDFAEELNISANELIMKLMTNGVMASINEEIDYDVAFLIAEEYGYDVIKERKIEDIDILDDLLDYDDKEDLLKFRPPVVTVMGHVDHGKTSLLDAIRDTNIIDKEAGGITQHIGASEIIINEKKITFLDTPGHEAFTEMRARGAKLTDIAILVVAADDGIMPQTLEAISHARAAGVPIIIAINKIDKPNANVDKVKSELAENGLLTEDWGGSTIAVEVSALKKTGIDELLEMVLLVAEMEELKANPDRKAKGIIIEAHLDKGKGPVATVLVNKGTLNTGDFVLIGATCGKIRTMINSKGKRISHAGPSIPVEITGLSQVPEAGELLYVVEDERYAKELAEKRKERIREEANKAKRRVSLDDLFNQIQSGEIKDLNIIIKADVRGSIEAIKQSLEKLSMEDVKVNTIHAGVGGINENDIMLASASNAIVIGFNVRPNNMAVDLAKEENVDIRTYRVIYNAIEDIQAAVKGMLSPEYKEVVQGNAEVRATFKVPNVGTVAGIYVTNGKISRKDEVRLLRNDVVIYEGSIDSLKRFKDDVSELNSGFEGGLSLDKYNDIKNGDVIEAFRMEEIER